MEINQDFRNELFKRQEVLVNITSEKNPSFTEMKKQISEEFSKPEENIEVFSIKGRFGNNQFTIKSYIYDSKEDLTSMEKLQLTNKQRKEKSKDNKEGKTDDNAIDKMEENNKGNKVENDKKEEANINNSSNESDKNSSGNEINDSKSSNKVTEESSIGLEDTDIINKNPTEDKPVEENPSEESKE